MATKSPKAALYSDQNHKPTILPPDLDAIAGDLRAADRWVLWRLEWKPAKNGGGKWSKVPFQPNGRRASSTDSKTWTNFVTVLTAHQRGGFDGVGYVLGDGWTGIDLDEVRNADTGELTADAIELVNRFATYTETSPSGTGVKLIGRGEWRGGWHRKPFPGGGEIEGYSAGRYFTATGQVIGSHPVGDIQAATDELAGRFAIRSRGASAGTRRPNAHDDGELVGRAMAAANGAKFRRLWEGDTADHGGDESRADLALCGLLAFWSGGDEFRIDGLFRQSGLMREKWDERRGETSYGRLTITKALEGKAEFYTPGCSSADRPPKKAGANGTTKPVAPVGPMSGAAVILDHFRERYRPVFRRGNAVVSADGVEVPMNHACAVPDSNLIARLAAASDAPTYQGGGVKRGSLPTFFSTWARVAWGDLLADMPEEDAAQLGTDSPTREEFRRLVREALLSEVVLGDTIGDSNVTQTERRSLIDWCERFAKPGPWRSIRSKQCWCKRVEKGGGEVVLRVAVRHEVFSQLHADRRLSAMGAKTFARRAAAYGVGRTSQDDRPHGRAAIILGDGFVAELVGGTPNDDECDVPER